MRNEQRFRRYHKQAWFHSLRLALGVGRTIVLGLEIFDQRFVNVPNWYACSRFTSDENDHR